MVTSIDEVAHVLVLDPMECTVAGPLSANSFVLLLLTSALTLATPSVFSYKWQIMLVVFLVITLAHFTHFH